jgi:hypothetical protein
VAEVCFALKHFEPCISACGKHEGQANKLAVKLTLATLQPCPSPRQQVYPWGCIFLLPIT